MAANAPACHFPIIHPVPESRHSTDMNKWQAEEIAQGALDGGFWSKAPCMLGVYVSTKQQIH
jgi:hypothetical protein